VAWNTSIAISKLVGNDSLSRAKGIHQIFNKNTTSLLLQIMTTKPNLKTRIQATQALHAYTSVVQMGGRDTIPDIWESLIDCLKFVTHFSGSTTEFKYLAVFESRVLDLWVRCSALTVDEVAKDAELLVDEADAVHSYFTSKATFTLLQQVSEYLRKELKVPQYSFMFDDKEGFDKETEALFRENSALEPKIAKLKIVMENTLKIIELEHEIKVSFAVFDGIKSLATCPVQQYRGLRVLKEVKSSFIPSFGDDPEATEEKKEDQSPQKTQTKS